MSTPEAHLESVDAVIDALGGTTEVGRLTGRGLAAVSNWRARGKMPSDLFVLMSDALQAIGRTASPSLWGMATAEPAEART